MKRGKAAGIAIGVCAALFIGGFGIHALIQQSDYAEADRLAQAGDTQAAYELFNRLSGYADAAERRDALVEADAALPYRTVAKGSLVTFGSWEQDGDVTNGQEPIGWIVLDRVDDRLLLLSEQCLASRPYNPAEFQAVTWEECELRSWLGADFLAGAFSDTEQSLIPVVENVNEDRPGSLEEDDMMAQLFEGDEENAEQQGVGGADTHDRVFLLSETEASIYLHDEVEREYTGKAQLTAAVSTDGIYQADDGCVGWWLRSPGVYCYTAQFVNDSGEPYPAGAYVELNYGVRPAIWLDVQEPPVTDGVG